MAETRKYPAQWVGVYRADINKYDHGTHPIRVGGSYQSTSYIGFSTQIKKDIEDSKTTPRIFLSLNILDTAEFDFGLHKESSNKGSGSMPYYRYAGIHPTLSKSATGSRRRVEITDISGALSVYENIDTFREALSKGYKGITLYGGSDYGSATGASSDSDEVLLEIEGSWNDPPTKPTVTYPNGGETITGTNTVTWNAASDPETSSSQLQYQFAVDDGEWHYLPLTNKGQTSLSVNFDKYSDTSTARVAVRAYDGQYYSGWDFSDGVYTISRNRPPTTPTGLSPVGGKKLDRTEIIEFKWNHNDADNQSKYDLRWRQQGSSSWNTITKTSTSERYLMPADMLPNGSIEWQVRTYDQRQEVSPYSGIAVMYAANQSNKPEILKPLQGALIADNNPTIEWSSIDQAAYDLEIWNGGSEVWSISNSSPNKAVTIQFDLTNNVEYQVRLRIKNTDGLWSTYDEIDFITDFTTPNSAELIPTVDQERGSITIEILNPIGNKVIDGIEVVTPVVEYNAIYRRKSDEDNYLMIADNVPADFLFTDYTPASGIDYEYKVTSHGDNGTFQDSEPIQANVVFFHAQLSIATNPDYWVQLKFNIDKSFAFNLDKSDLAFNGRVNPVAEFSVHEEKNGSIQCIFRSFDQVELLERIISSKKPLIYRDARGRRDFVSVDGISVADQGLNIYKVDFKITKIYYKEAI